MDYKILVVDDDQEIVQAIQIYLEMEDFNVVCATDGEQALKIVDSEEIHLILLDVMMPKMDGLQVLERVRETKSIPVIMVSAKSEDIDKIGGLERGADDYITKPFNPQELIARVKSHLRRYAEYSNISQDGPVSHIYQQGGLVLDDERKKVFVDQEQVSLTPIEYRILFLLLKNPGKVYSSDEIYEEVWEEESMGSVQTVAVHIRHIREKIEINPKDPRYLKVVWGLGYKIEAQRDNHGEERNQENGKENKG